MNTATQIKTGVHTISMIVSLAHSFICTLGSRFCMNGVVVGFPTPARQSALSTLSMAGGEIHLFSRCTHGSSAGGSSAGGPYLSSHLDDVAVGSRVVDTSNKLLAGRKSNLSWRLDDMSGAWIDSTLRRIKRPELQTKGGWVTTNVPRRQARPSIRSSYGLAASRRPHGG
jgi:hypothetical protein